MSRVAQKLSNGETFPFTTFVLLATSLAIGWVWLVATTHLHEMIVGAAVVVIATFFLVLVHRSQSNTVQLRWKDVAQGWRIPWYMVGDTLAVTRVLLFDLLHLHSAGSYYRVCDFAFNERNPAALGRDVLTTIYMSATPNSIVLGIDPQSGRMLFHQLEPAHVPIMAQSLGVRS